ncbi:hypothetical protein PRSY57_0415200 [Plasmodium reichenowi]|uniref:Uncharacterized protein n=1 Tax=Plasmodium reichenowi TaxID=5854 RepID=A0A151LSJ5_PLARE|nr:hypothetical protein PRSY57_0415200 [Plasmodium reichenowi]KYO02142.1 hypothetical protein PRSY57_0415200 [Plasmodium reichenowi]
MIDIILKMFLGKYFESSDNNFISVNMESGIEIRNIIIKNDEINNFLKSKNIDIEIVYLKIEKINISFVTLSGILTLKIQGVDLRVKPNIHKNTSKQIKSKLTSLLKNKEKDCTGIYLSYHMDNSCQNNKISTKEILCCCCEKYKNEDGSICSYNNYNNMKTYICKECSLLKNKNEKNNLFFEEKKNITNINKYKIFMNEEKNVSYDYNKQDMTNMNIFKSYNKEKQDFPNFDNNINYYFYNKENKESINNTTTNIKSIRNNINNDNKNNEHFKESKNNNSISMNNINKLYTNNYYNYNNNISSVISIISDTQNYEKHNSLLSLNKSNHLNNCDLQYNNSLSKNVNCKYKLNQYENNFNEEKNKLNVGNKKSDIEIYNVEKKNELPFNPEQNKIKYNCYNNSKNILLSNDNSYVCLNNIFKQSKPLKKKKINNYLCSYGNKKLNDPPDKLHEGSMENNFIPLKGNILFDNINVQSKYDNVDSDHSNLLYTYNNVYHDREIKINVDDVFEKTKE